MNSHRGKNRPGTTQRRLGWLALLAAILVGAGGIYFKVSRPKSNPAVSSARPSPLVIEPDAATFAAYAGSASCRECHAKAYDLWKGSHHALGERALDPNLDQSAFDPPRRIQHGSQISEARMRDGRLELLTLGPANATNAFPAERVIGVDPLKQFLIAAPGGRYQVAELAVDPHRNEWFDIFGDEDRKPGEWGHWTGRGMTWNVMCAACHNTRVRKNYEGATDSYNTAMAERGVGCEACHGPMADHVAWQRGKVEVGGQRSEVGAQRKEDRGQDPTLRRLDKGQMMAVCGSCHARRSELTGDFRPGDRFSDHFSLTIPDETDLYHPDGQVHEEDYEYTSFLSSRMFHAGVRCGDCHEAHSSKPILSGNLLCMRCHAQPIPPAPKIDPGKHSFHRPGEVGDRCVDCHMPVTVFMQRHARRDHGFTIPDPLLTKQHRVPNACNRCHQDKSVDWAIDTANQWYGPRLDRPTRSRTQWIAQGRAGQRSAVEPLVRLMREEKIPLWRAVAAGLLKPWASEPAVMGALVESLRDADPLVRVASARSLELLASSARPGALGALQNLLHDPIRAVRIEAAWAMHATIDTNLVAARDLMHSLQVNFDQPSGAMQMGAYLMDRGDNLAALDCFQKAVRWDANSAPLRHALAVSLSLQGRSEEAVKELEAACRLAPREAEYQFKLGLALNEVGRLNEAVAALEAAVKLDPQFAQAWYNLGLAYSALEKPEVALEVLARAESLNATSAQIPYARATILARLGRIEEARAAAMRAVQIQPTHAEAAALLQTLEP